MPADDSLAVYEWIKNVIRRNNDKPFVDRIVNREKYPVLDLGDGNIATHKMSWSEVDGKYIVYPTVLYDGKELKDYGDNAIKKVLETGDYITFDTPKEADLFSKKYKVMFGD